MNFILGNTLQHAKHCTDRVIAQKDFEEQRKGEKRNKEQETGAEEKEKELENEEEGEKCWYER